MDCVLKQTEEICTMLRELRIGQKMTQKKLGELTGIKANRISEIERHVVIPELTTLVKLLDALGYKLDIAKK